MKVAEYKQIDEHIEEYTITIPAEYDEEGNVIVEEHEEIRTRTVPVIGMVYREMTPEEIADISKEQSKFEREYWQSIDYDEAVNNEIRKRYSASEEFAILRQRDSKQEEYSAYYAYCEECKAYVKKMIAESNSETPDSGEV